MRKNIWIMLFMLASISLSAQKLAGLYDASAGMGVFMYTPVTNKMELSKIIPEPIGMPDSYWPSLCQYNGKVYGRTSIQYQGGNGSIYEYNPATNTYILLHAFKLKPVNYSRYEVVVSKTGLLYGIASDSVSGAYVFELDPATKQMKKYVTPKVAEYDIINAHYVTIAENNKMYFVVEGTDAENNPISKIIEFDLSSKLFTEKLATKEIPAVSHMAWDAIADIGEGKLAGTVNTSGFPLIVFVYDYTINKITSYKFDSKLYGRSEGAPVRYGADFYIMASSNQKNGFGSLLKINRITGTYEEVANFSKLSIYYPATGCIVNDILYGSETGDKIFSYDFKTKQISLVHSLKEDKIGINSGFILVK